jgi:hypothetical protein
MIDLKEDREDYLVRPEILAGLEGEFVYKTIFTAINRQGVVFLWPVRLPLPDDRKSDWPRSAREAAEMAMTRWLRVQANMSLGAYEPTVAEAAMGEPVWPDASFQELVRIAYRDRMITNLDRSSGGEAAARARLSVRRIPRGGGGGLRVHRCPRESADTDLSGRP